MASYSPGFVNLSGYQSIDLDSPDLPAFSSHSSEASTFKERRKWSPEEDVILIIFQEESKHTELKTVLEMKDKLNKQKLLEKLLEKPGPLSEIEMSLKLKLMSEMLG
ncbi:hypothetical protein Bca52824_023346 [Brassica carinata]|uniref:Uncharacterized protein n=1 Tax=Brassica carinata TaxID=52824 RepID=A0A8X7VI06_BRACI|nr:hypothetical protein Bca52824_023346 [Brassica carinata]